MHGENLELSLKDREPVNVYVTILFLKILIRLITYRQSECSKSGGVISPGDKGEPTARRGKNSPITESWCQVPHTGHHSILQVDTK